LNRISAQEDRLTAAPKQHLSDAAEKQRSAGDRRQEADRLDQLATRERDARRSGRTTRGRQPGHIGSQRSR
ncbi:MAG TPA: hypothetical protein VIV12_02615, partial [Streptosporangiaceae bacterium]